MSLLSSLGTGFRCQMGTYFVGPKIASKTESYTDPCLVVLDLDEQSIKILARNPSYNFCDSYPKRTMVSDLIPADQIIYSLNSSTQKELGLSSYQFSRADMAQFSDKQVELLNTIVRKDPSAFQSDLPNNPDIMPTFGRLSLFSITYKQR